MAQSYSSSPQILKCFEEMKNKKEDFAEFPIEPIVDPRSSKRKTSRTLLSMEVINYMLINMMINLSMIFMLYP